MKTKTISAAAAIASLLALGGTAIADSDPHGAYNRAFYGDGGSSAQWQTESMGKAAFGTSTGDPHAAYRLAFYGEVAASGAMAPTESMGKAAFGTDTSAIDAQTAYHSAFVGD